ncbi:hypothetical protein BDP27DRAFT_1431388 [Rhodocollybia butyracea]|uniref:Carboxypeptidase S n=1 Tax=Rhodocollybia butyracea TaxID=206335 RepID=A0A9P5P9J0_9AGAR|nr:hypothetical protein BDP27DRAFT_1431388 [Rhodocollybia butyracea]
MYPSSSAKEKSSLSISNAPGNQKIHVIQSPGRHALSLFGNNYYRSPHWRSIRLPDITLPLPATESPLWRAIGEIIDTVAFKGRAVDWLAGAVRIPTEAYNDFQPIGIDPRWEPFGQFHEYLLEAFPLVHSTLSLTKINTYGLLYEWTGTDPSLKPVLLAAHQDVVPVDPSTISEWTFPPYSGHFDGMRIWGRVKTPLQQHVNNRSAVETMVENGFVPKRTFVLAFGCDEETTGKFGAFQLRNSMLSIYGPNAFAFIVDEGGGFTEEFGTVFATPGVTEKGYMDLRVDVASPGGHSSVPPSHTTIGIISRLLVELENHPYPVEMSTHSVFYKTLQCYASHGKTIPSDLRNAIIQSSHSREALRQLGDVVFTDPRNAALVGTTQAIDLIRGGVKSNALPEHAYAVVNHRISTLSSIQKVISHATNTLKPLADSFNLVLTSFGETISEDASGSSAGTLVLSDAFNSSLAPAPITPTYGVNAGPYRLLAGTIRATYNAHRGLDSESESGDSVSSNIIVAPGTTIANTDTRYYWDLSDGQIFRPLPDERPRASVANLIGRFEQQNKRHSGSFTGALSTTPTGTSTTTAVGSVGTGSGSRSSSVVSNITGDSAKEEVKEKREWPPTSTAIGTGEGLAPPAPIYASAFWSKPKPKPSSDESVPVEPPKALSPSPTSPTSPIAKPSRASTLSPTEVTPNSNPKASPTKSGNASPAAAARAKAAATTVPRSGIMGPIKAQRTGPTTPNLIPAPKTPTSKTPRPSGIPKTPGPPLSPSSRPKTPSSISHSNSHSTTSNSNSNSTSRPKTPSSGLFAPTAASLARSRNQPPPPKTPTRKVSVSNAAVSERLSKPTAASLSKVRDAQTVSSPPMSVSAKARAGAGAKGPTTSKPKPMPTTLATPRKTKPVAAVAAATNGESHEDNHEEEAHGEHSEVEVEEHEHGIHSKFESESQSPSHESSGSIEEEVPVPVPVLVHDVDADTGADVEIEVEPVKEEGGEATQ